MALAPTSVTFGGLTVDDSGDYHLTNIAGWEGLPEARYDSFGRPNGHGEFDTPVYSGARVVHLEGECYDVAQRDAILSTLSAGLGFSGADAAKDLTVTLASRTLTTKARVIRYSTAIARGDWGVGWFGWQADFRCPDPLRYGITQTVGPYVLAAATGGLVFPLFMPSGVLSWGTLPTPQTLTLTNTGSADAPVTLSVAANGAAITGGFQILESTTGRSLRYADDLAAGDVVVFDSGAGTVIINGSADRRGSLTVAQWTPVPPSSSRTFYLAPLGGPNSTASLTASMRPAYW